MADSNYVIEIAAEFASGEQTIDRLDALSARLTGTGRKSSDFQDAILRLATQMDVLKASTAGAESALADASARYAGLEKDAISASKALERAKISGVIPDDVAARAEATARAVEDYTSTVARLEDKVRGARGEQEKLEKVQQALHKIGVRNEEQAAVSLRDFGRLHLAVSQLPGPLGRLGGQIVSLGQANNALSSSFGEGTAKSVLLLGAFAALAVGAIYLTVKTVEAAVSLARYVVVQADAARSALLTRDAFSALSKSTSAAVDYFDDIERATGATDASLIDLTKSLRAAKIGAADMPSALRAAALAEAALGKGGATEFIDKLKAGTLTVKDFATTVENKFGGIVAKQILSLDNQTATFKRNLAGIFESVDVEPLLRGLSILVGMFEKTNPIARFFGIVLNGVFGTAGSYAETFAFAVEAAVLRISIWLVKGYLAFRSFGDLLGGTSNLVTGVLVVFGAALAAVVVPLAIVGVLLGAIAAAMIAIPLLFNAVTNAIVDFIDAADKFVLGLVDRAVSWGADLISGFIRGILSMAGALVDTVTGAVGKAVEAAKNVLGIHSPSRVFAEIGLNTAAGFSAGVDSGAEDAQGAVSAMVGSTGATSTSAVSGTDAGPPAKGGGRGGGADLSGATFNFYGVKDGEDALSRFRELATALLEDTADSLTGARV